MTYADSTKKQKRPHYEHKVYKLDMKHNNFTERQFQQIRKSSKHKKILKAFERIGMCLNGQDFSHIPEGHLDKVCFILINSYTNRKHDLGVGPLNDGYLVALKHYRLGYKIFYLYNPNRKDFISLLSFFLMNTEMELTVFYTGRDTICTGIHGIEFIDGILTTRSICDIIAKNCNEVVRVMLISDCCSGGSVFDIQSNQQGFSHFKIISFSVNKESAPESKEGKLTHGIFTYYLCKITSQSPNISPKDLINQLNPSLQRFKEVCVYEATNKRMPKNQLFFN